MIPGRISMQSDTITLRIRKFLAEHFPLTRNIGNSSRLLGNGLLDSLAILDVVTFLEKEFQITVTDEELLPENFQSIDSLTAFVQGKLNVVIPRDLEK